MTGSIGVVTLNLPRAAYTSVGNKKVFFATIKNLLEIARRSLITKREAVEKFTELGLYPYSKHYLKKIKEGQGSYWANHFNTIGILGMHEACLNLINSQAGTFIDYDVEVDMGSALPPNLMEKIEEVEKLKVNQWITDEQAMRRLNLPQEHIDKVMEENEEEYEMAEKLENSAKSRSLRSFLGWKPMPSRA